MQTAKMMRASAALAASVWGSISLVSLFLASRTVAGCSSDSPPASTCGVGTRNEGGICVVDHPSDGDSGGAAQEAGLLDGATSTEGPQLTLSPDDVLMVGTRRGDNNATLLVDSKVCFLLTVLHSDGTKTVVPRNSGASIAVSASKAEIIDSADPTDCYTGGIIGVSAGVTQVTVKLTAGNVTLSGNSVATVTSSPLQIAPRAGTESLPFLLAAGATTHAQVLVQESGALEGASYVAPLDFEWKSAAGDHPPDAELVWRWMTVTIANASLASADHLTGNDGDLWAFHGQAVGSTTLTATYQAPHGALQVSRALNVLSKPTPAPPTDYVSVVLVAAGDKEILSAGDMINAPFLYPGVCFVPRMWALVRQPANGYLSFDLDAPMTVTAKTNGTASTSPGNQPGETCISGSGVTRLTTCQGGLCATLPIVTMVPGALQKIELKALSTTPVIGGHQGTQYVFCPEIRVTATLSGGVTFDATRVSGFGAYGTNVTATQAKDATYAHWLFSPPDADDADPCFALPMGKQLSGPGTTTFNVGAFLRAAKATLDVVVTGTTP